MPARLSYLRRLLFGITLLVGGFAHGQPDWLDTDLAHRFDSLLSLAETYPDDSIARKSWLLHEAGKVADSAGKPEQAITTTERALALRLKDEDRFGDGVLLSAMNLGIYHSGVEDYRDALRYFGMVTERAPNRKEAVAWFQAGRVYGFTGRFAEGEQAFRRALALPTFADSPYLTAYLQQQIGALNLRRHNAEGGALAITPLVAALRYFVETDDEEGEMETRNFLGWAYAETGDYDKATDQLRRAIDLARRLDVPETVASAYGNLGLAFRRRGNPESAIGAYRQGLEVLAKAGADTGEQATFFSNLSTVELERGHHGEAVSYAQRALESAIPEYRATSANDLPTLATIAYDRLGALVYLQDLARAQRAGQTPADVAAALSTYRRADELLDLMRHDQLLEDTRNYWRADARRLYDEAILAALEADDAAAVFYFMEKARARLLLDEMSAGKAEELLPERLRRRLADRSRRVRLRPENPEVLAAFRTLQDSVLTAYPEYALQRMGAPPPTLKELPKLLNGRYLVEYYVSTAVALAIVVSPEGKLRTIRLPAPSVWEPLLWTYRQQLTDPNVALDAAVGVGLYKSLIAPLGLSSGTDLVVVPDAELYLLPFGALLTAEPEADATFATWPWMADAHGVSYAHSAQLLRLSGELHGRGNGRVLALAPAVRLPADYPAAELPATLQTLGVLTDQFPADTLTGAAASRTAFREQADAYSVLHLGTHASPREGGGFLLRGNPAWYSQQDLLDHRLRAELVVIGACETGLGEPLLGEGIASLGRGFARRGAPGVTMSLWSVDDAATAGLLNRFYTMIGDGAGPGTALHLAGQAARRDATNPRRSHPYYWAGLVYYGSDQPLDLASGNSGKGGWWGWFALGILALGLLWWLLRKPS